MSSFVPLYSVQDGDTHMHGGTFLLLKLNLTDILEVHLLGDSEPSLVASSSGHWEVTRQGANNS